MNELPPPQELQGACDATEVARVWVNLGELHVVLGIGVLGSDQGPGEASAWADVIADLIRHIANAIAQQSGAEEPQILRELLKRLRELEI